jgi:ketosteroid isomerase-like protein
MITGSPAEAAELLEEANGRGDHDAVMDFYEDGAVMVVGQERLAAGRDEIRSVYRWIFANIEGPVPRGENHIVEAGDIALLTSEWDSSGVTSGGDFVGRESFATVIMRRHPDGGWRIVLDNSWSRAARG